MATKENLTTNLKEKYGCKLTQEEIGIRMGLPADACGKYTQISRFECGNTANWGVKHFFGYSHVTGIPPEVLFCELYPEEEYSKSLLEKDEEQIMRENGKSFQYIMPTIAYTNKKMGKLLSGNVVLIGHAGAQKTRRFAVPGIMRAMLDDKNVFAVLAPEEIFLDEITELAKQTGHEVIISTASQNKLNWFDSLNEPETVAIFTEKVLMSLCNEDMDPYWRESTRVFIEEATTNYLWNNGTSPAKRDIGSFLEYLNQLQEKSTEELARMGFADYVNVPGKVAKAILTKTIATVSSLKAYEDKNTVPMLDVFNKKHVIIYAQTMPYWNITADIALAEYMRLLENVKGYGENHRDTRSYKIIIDGICDMPTTNGSDIVSWMSAGASNQTEILLTTQSIEQLRVRCADSAQELLDIANRVIITGTPRNCDIEAVNESFGGNIEFSDGTLRYITEQKKRGFLSRMFGEKTALASEVIDASKVETFPKSAIICIEHGKEPEIVTLPTLK